MLRKFSSVPRESAPSPGANDTAETGKVALAEQYLCPAHFVYLQPVRDLILQEVASGRNAAAVA
jgi:hypothetical protein